MKPLAAVLLLSLAFVLTACGGGGAGPQQDQATWAYVPPSPGTVAMYSEVFTDNASNVINVTERYDYAPGASGVGLTLTRSDQTGQIIVNGTPYGGFAYVEQFDASGGRTSRALVSGGAPYTCTFNPAEVAIPYPLSAQSTWNTASAASCTDGRLLNYTFTNGSVVGPEDLNLSIGQFHTLHVRYTANIASTGNAYLQHVAIDLWVDVNSGVYVRIRQAYSYSGGPPATGYPTSASFDLSGYIKGG